MGMIESRRRMMMAQGGGEPPTPTPSYGGIPVYIDNCRFGTSGGKADAYTEDSDFFLAFGDAGTSTQKPYSFTRIGASKDATARWYNDLTANSVDYSTIMRTDMTAGEVQVRNSNVSGRYVIVSIEKQYASKFFMQINGTDYLMKGNDVT